MKGNLRKEMLKLRESHHGSNGRAHCEKIAGRLFSLEEFKSARCVLLYASKGSEVHTHGIIERALSDGKRVALPRVVLEKKQLELYEIKSAGELSVGAFGVPEPISQPSRRLEPEKIDLAVVPGVSFDLLGHRIGYGMGYYDSLLASMSGKKVGLAYEVQLADKIPVEPHDVAVDIIITERRTIRCGGGAGSKLRVAVLASGRGSDFQSLIDAANGGELSGIAEIVGLISDNPGAQAIERAKGAGIPSFVIAHNSREELDEGIKKRLEALSPDLVVLAGYMKIIRSPSLLFAYAGRMINIHPSLLPKYPGAHAQKDAFDAGEKVSGYTIHFVDQSLDGGPVILQEKVDISGCKNWEEAAARILKREHEGLPRAVGMFARGKFDISGKEARYAAIL